AVSLRLIAAATVFGLALVAVGLRVIVVVESTQGIAPILAFGVGVGVGVGVGLPVLALLYAVRRQRVAVFFLAFCLGLSVNVVFLANAVPANAASGNTSVFYLDGAVSSACGNAPMWQTNADTGPGSFTGGAGVQYKWCSDTFA